MAETRAQSQKTKKIAALSKVSEHHEQTLQEIQRQLQTINVFMQRMVEAEEKKQQSPNSGSKAILVNNNLGNSESSSMNLIKNLKLEFPRFQGEDPTCWVYDAKKFFSYNHTPKHQQVMMASYHLDGEALIWF